MALHDAGVALLGVRHPLPLGPGSKVRLIAPAGSWDPAALLAGVEILLKRGYQVLMPPQQESAHFRVPYLAGTDGWRSQLVNQALTEEGTDAVWAIRGGYGSARLLPCLDWEGIQRATPRWLLGFSDLTALLTACAFGRGFCGMPVHGPNVTTLPQVSEDDRQSLWRLLESGGGGDGSPQWGPVTGLCPLSPLVPEVSGTAKGEKIRGRIVGGNLAVYACLAGTALGKRVGESKEASILFLEEIKEAPYRLDRSVHHLGAAGLLHNVRAVILGEFVGCGAQDDVRAALSHAFAEHHIPVLWGFPAGHGSRNHPLPIGLPVEIDLSSGTVGLAGP